MTNQKKKTPNPINLNCYFIRFHKKNQSDFLKINEVFKPRDFKTEMDEFKKFYLKFTYANEQNNRILYLQKILSQGSDVISGVMKRGHNGQETDIDEMVGGKANTVSSIKADQYNSIYFFFLISLPKQNCDYLVFIAQTFKQYGFKDLFAESYKKYISEKLGDDITCTFHPLTLPKLFSKYIKEGEIKKLRFKKHSLPKNAENLLGDGDSKNIKDYEIELSVKAKRKGGFLGVKNIDFETTKFIELFDVANEYDEAFADVSINNRIRYINISHPEKFTATFDLTNVVTIDKLTNRPNYKELNNEAINILRNEILINL